MMPANPYDKTSTNAIPATFFQVSSPWMRETMNNVPEEIVDAITMKSA